MKDLNNFMKYKIDDHPSYKLITIKILSFNINSDEKEEVIKFMKKIINDLDTKYKIIIEFSYMENIEIEDVKKVLNLYGDKYNSIIKENIILIIAVIPNTIINKAIQLYLYFNDLGFPLKIVDNMYEAIDLIDI